MQVNAFPHKRFAERKDWSQFDTYYFSGAAHAIRRTVFDKVGYYPENFFYGMEEYDLSFRALDAGYIIRYTDKVVILHKESPTGRLTPKEKRKGMWLNKTTVAWKYLPLRYFISTALIWSLWYLLKSKGDLGGYFKGWAAIFRMTRTEKRRPVGLAYLKKVKARLAY
jgi:GT2 family glycosyltransferase